jgi:hypothetical protein
MTAMFNKNWEFDLEFGEIRERRLAEIFQHKKIEVKTERGLWAETGNLAIEIEYRGNPSGLATTQAEYWVHILELNGVEFCSLLFPVSTLKKTIKSINTQSKVNIVMGGDDNQSKLVLVPLTSIFKIAKQVCG